MLGTCSPARSLVLPVLYGMLQSIPVVMIGIHGFTLEQSSLPFIAVAIGTTLGILVNMVLQKKYFVLLKVSFQLQA